MKAVRNICGILVMMTLVLVACTTAKSQYEKGNYYDSVMRSVEKLRKSPNNKNARETLANAYPQAVNTFMDKLENEDHANVDFKYTKAVYTYQKLNKMYESINVRQVPRMYLAIQKNIIKQLIRSNLMQLKNNMLQGCINCQWEAETMPNRLTIIFLKRISSSPAIKT